MTVTSKHRSDPALISIRSLLSTREMDKLSAPVLLSKDYAPTTLSFEEYALKLTGITDLLDARVLAVDTVSCAESPLNE